MNAGRPREFDRTAVLESAMQLFWDHGYGATGTAQILDETGLSRSSFYNAFGDKRTLFLEAVEQYAEQLLGQCVDLLEAPGSPIDNVKSLCAAWKELAREHGTRGCLLVKTSAEFGPSDPEVSRRIEACAERLEGALADCFERARLAGELDSAVSSRSLARLFLSTSHGLAVLSQVKGAEFVDEAVDALLALLPAPARR